MEIANISSNMIRHMWQENCFRSKGAISSVSVYSELWAAVGTEDW